MSLVTNNISGSVQDRSRIGITGSVIFANTPGPIFPPLPGNDVTFFVSGSNIERAVFGGTTVVSGTFSVSGNSILSTVIEPLLNNNNSGGVTTFSLTNQSIFYVNGASSNITANFTNAKYLNIIASTRISWLMDMYVCFRSLKSYMSHIVMVIGVDHIQQMKQFMTDLGIHFISSYPTCFNNMLKYPSMV